MVVGNDVIRVSLEMTMSLLVKSRYKPARGGHGISQGWQPGSASASRRSSAFRVRPMDRAMNNARQKDPAAFDPEAKAA